MELTKRITLQWEHIHELEKDPIVNKQAIKDAYQFLHGMQHALSMYIEMSGKSRLEQ